MIARNASLVLLTGLLLAACGGGDGGQGLCDLYPADPLCIKTYADGDACTRALHVVFDGYDQACQNYPGCCFCACWQDGRQQPDSWEPCTCIPVGYLSCDEEMQGFAEQCLADPEACRRAVDDVVANQCMEW